MSEEDWDAIKAEDNAAKHGVSFLEARSVFDDPFAIVDPDARHSGDEERWRWLGMSRLNRLLVVIASADRIISARRATKRERHDVERRRRA